MTKNVTQQDIQATLNALDIGGAPLCVHASLRSFGNVVGGAISVRDAFVQEGCTLLVPSFSWSYAVPPPSDQRFPQNGWKYATYAGPTTNLKRMYTPFTNDIDADMGAIARAVMNHTHRIRGQHPLCSFTALGRQAAVLIQTQQPDNVYAPLVELTHLKGFVLLIGVGMNKMTLLHLAEKVAGRRLFRRWANNPQGHPIAVEVGGCSAGFESLQTVLRPITQTVQVGQSIWHLLPAHEVLQRASTIIRTEPTITHCSDPKCERCNDAISGGPFV